MTPLYRSKSAEQHSGVVRGAGWGFEAPSEHQWQMVTWGYAIVLLRHIPGLNPAHLCEMPGDGYRSIGGILTWDMPELLDTVTIDRRRPADWHALWWVREHVRRGHEPHPGSEA